MRHRALFLLAILSACGHSDNARRAVEALERLEEYDRAGALLYEPRYLEAEKAIAETGKDKDRFNDCLYTFKSSRLEQGALAAARDTKTLDFWKAQFTATRKRKDTCMAGLRALAE